MSVSVAMSVHMSSAELVSISMSVSLSVNISSAELVSISISVSLSVTVSTTLSVAVYVSGDSGGSSKLVMGQRGFTTKIPDL